MKTLIARLAGLCSLHRSARGPPPGHHLNVSRLGHVVRLNLGFPTTEAAETAFYDMSRLLRENGRLKIDLQVDAEKIEK